MIDRLLTSIEGHDLEDPAKKDLPMHMAVDEIQFDFSRRHCQCLLRTAEKVGFKYAAIIMPQVTGDCAQTKTVDSKVFESSPIALCEREGFFETCKANRVGITKD